MSELVNIGLDDLRAHPANSNVMPERLLVKLVEHITQTEHYPPLIVRPMPGEAGAFQVMDGHHRWQALKRAGHTDAKCVVWEVDDAGALMLLSTLNRLQGADDPKRRAALVGQLQERCGRSTGDLAKLLPESRSDLGRLMQLREPAPRPAPPPALRDMPVAVHFFLTAEQKRRLESRLKAIGPTREAALMSLIDAGSSDTLAEPG